MRRILILPSWYPTKDNDVRGIFFREQAFAIQRYGFQVSVIPPPHLYHPRLFVNQFGKLQHGISLEEDNGLPTYQWYGLNWVPRSHKINLKLILQAGMKMFGDYVANTGKPDLIHVHSAFPYGILASRIKKNYKVPFIVTEHSSAIATGILQDWKKKLISKVYLYADKRIVVSPKLGDLLKIQYREAFESWTYIPNIVDKRFSTNNVLSQYEVGKNQNFRFLNIGSLTKNKGQSDLLYAFAQGFRGDKNIELRIGGVGPMRKDLEELINDLNIQDQVVLLGQLSRKQVLCEMQLATTFILSSHFETFGVVLIEALACGKCVIATTCGGPECIVNDRNGLLVPVQDTHEMAKAMIQIYKTYATYSPTAIRNDCLARFGEEVVIDQLSDIYNVMINR